MRSTEIVWDRGGAITAQSGDGTLAAGPGASWSPELMLATAVGVSICARFLELAAQADLPLLGYVAQQFPTFDDVTGQLAAIAVTACVSVPSAAAARDRKVLLNMAAATAPIARAVHCPVHCEINVVVLADLDAGSACV